MASTDYSTNQSDSSKKKHNFGRRFFYGAMARERRFRGVTKSYVKDLNLDYLKPSRAGVIMYSVEDNILYFGMGRDTKTHDLTDFGGGISYKKEDAISGALREFHEETLGTFPFLEKKDVEKCPVLFDDNNLVIFVRTDLNREDISRAFSDRLPNFSCPEVVEIVWLSAPDFFSAINNERCIYRRVRRLLQCAGDFTHLL